MQFSADDGLSFYLNVCKMITNILAIIFILKSILMLLVMKILFSQSSQAMGPFGLRREILGSLSYASINLFMLETIWAWKGGNRFAYSFY